jgi:hypothetical protein
LGRHDDIETAAGTDETLLLLKLFGRIQECPSFHAQSLQGLFTGKYHPPRGQEVLQIYGKRFWSV